MKIFYDNVENVYDWKKFLYRNNIEYDYLNQILMMTIVMIYDKLVVKKMNDDYELLEILVDQYRYYYYHNQMFLIEI